MSVDRLKFTFLILFILFFSQNYLLRFCSFRCWTQQRIQVNINRPSEKKRSKQRQFIIIIYSWWSFFLILIPSTDLWKAELTDRMTEQTQNSWNGDFPTSTIASVIENRFCFFFNCRPSELWSTSSLSFLIRTCVCQDWRGGAAAVIQPSFQEPSVFCWISMSSAVFGGQLLSTGPGSSFSGWQLYTK